MSTRIVTPLAGRQFAVPMAGVHVRRVYDERCRRPLS
jgi:hypothetical protein